MNRLKNGMQSFASAVAILLLVALPAYAANLTAEFQEVDGDVFVIKGGTGKKIKAEVGMRVGPGDVVESWEGGDAELLYEDGNVTVIDQKTYIKIQELSIEGTNATSVLSLAVGRVKNSVTKIAGTKTKFEVRTKSAVAGVTGTPDWVVSVTRGNGGKKHTTEVDLLGKPGQKGSLLVKGTGTKASTKPITLTPGTRTMAKLGLPPVKPFKISAQRANNLVNTLPVKTSTEKRAEKRKAVEKKVEKAKKEEKKKGKKEEEKKEEDSKDKEEKSNDEESAKDKEDKSNDEEASKDEESSKDTEESKNEEAKSDESKDEQAKEQPKDENKDESAKSSEDSGDKGNEESKEQSSKDSQGSDQASEDTGSTKEQSDNSSGTGDGPPSDSAESTSSDAGGDGLVGDTAGGAGDGSADSSSSSTDAGNMPVVDSGGSGGDVPDPSMSVGGADSSGSSAGADIGGGALGSSSAGGGMGDAGVSVGGATDSGLGAGGGIQLDTGAMMDHITSNVSVGEIKKPSDDTTGANTEKPTAGGELPNQANVVPTTTRTILTIEIVRP